MLTYAMSMELHFDEKEVQNFLLSIGDAVNGMMVPVAKQKTKIYKHKRYFTIVVKVKFIDGTKMKFKQSFELDVNAKMNALDEQQLALAMAQQGYAQVEETNVQETAPIGFKLE